jgi:uncharacterized protein YozE (UPF0346 family)
LSGESVTRMKISELTLDPKNARKGSVAVIADSLREFGQHRPVVVQRKTNRVIAGNHLVKAAQVLGWTELDVQIVDDDDLKALRRSIADNAVGDQATWDLGVLKELIDVSGSDVPGLDEALLAKVYKEQDEATATPVYPILAKPGEKYDYVMFFTEDEADATFLMSVFGDEWKDWKHRNRPPTRSRILPVSVLRKTLERHGSVPTPQAGD